MFGLSKFANRNKIETEGRDAQNICECKCRRNLHNAYVCYNSLFPHLANRHKNELEK